MKRSRNTVLLDFPISLEVDGLMKRAHVHLGGQDEKDFRRLVDLARQVGRPKAIYREAHLENRGEGFIQAEGMIFRSSFLARNMESTERFFAYVATCGMEMDEADPSRGDPLMAFWWDVLKGCLLNEAHRHLMEVIDRRHRLGKSVSMNPGSGDVHVWPIEQQRELFQLLGNVEEDIGVELTPSFLMRPNKTISGVRFSTERDFRSCQVCRRETCSSRSAPLDQKLWEELTGEHG